MSSLFSYFKPTQEKVKKEPSTPSSSKGKKSRSESLSLIPNGNSARRKTDAARKIPEIRNGHAETMRQLQTPNSLPVKRGMSEDEDSEGEIGVRKVSFLCLYMLLVGVGGEY